MDKHLAKIKVATVFLCLTVAFSIAALFENRNQVCDIISQCKLILAIVSLGLAIRFGTQRKRKCLVVAATLVLLNSFQILLLFIPNFVHHSGEYQSLKVMTVNLDAPHNKNYKIVFDQIDDLDPDLIGFVEVNNDWRSTLHTRLARYKFSLFNMDGGGVSLFSKYPLVQNLKVPGEAGRPRLQANLSMNGKQF